MAVYGLKWLLSDKMEDETLKDAHKISFSKDHVVAVWSYLQKPRAEAMARSMMDQINDKQEGFPTFGYWKGRPVGVGTARLLVLGVCCFLGNVLLAINSSEIEQF